MSEATQTSYPAISTGAVAKPKTSASFVTVVDGDTYADWEGPYVDNVDRIYRLVYSGFRNRPDADYLTAEVFKAALCAFRRDSSRDEVRAYLLATARTILASHWRLSRNQPANSHPVISDGLLKYMSVRDATLAAGVSQSSGNALQCRALFVAASLAEGDK